MQDEIKNSARVTVAQQIKWETGKKMKINSEYFKENNVLELREILQCQNDRLAKCSSSWLSLTSPLRVPHVAQQLINFISLCQSKSLNKIKQKQKETAARTRNCHS